MQSVANSPCFVVSLSRCLFASLRLCVSASKSPMPPKSLLTYFQPCCILGILHCIQSCVPAPADSRQEKPISGLPSASQNGNDPVFDMVVGQKWRSIKRPNSVGFSLTLSSSIPTASCSAGLQARKRGKAGVLNAVLCRFLVRYSC